MSNNIKKKIKDARIKLFRRDYKLDFFGALLYKFNWVVTEMPMEAEGGILFNLKDLNSTEDGNIYINKHYIEKNDYTSGNLLALLFHELFHILEKHGTRRKNRHFKIWNIAADHVNDRELKKIFGDFPSDLTFYQNNFNIIDRLDREKPKCSAEEAYDWIMENWNIKKISIEEKTDENGNPVALEITDEQTGEKTTISLDLPEKSGQDQNKENELVENYVAQARALYETMKSRGQISGGVQEHLDKILKVEIPWEELLEKAIKKNTILRPDERSWRQLNKYYFNHGLTLPGYSMTEEQDAIGHLIIAADSSGSVSTDNLKKWASVLMDSMKYFQKIFLLVHDVQVHQIVEFDKDDTQKFYDFIKNTGFKGRGGTSHTPVFDYIEENHWNDVDYRDNLSMVISLTDGYSNIDHIYQKYEFIKNNTPLIFTLCSNWEFNPEIGEIEFIHIN
ncbi:MAG: DUF2201 family putative metallopeptidase [bacterium]